MHSRLSRTLVCVIQSAVVLTWCVAPQGMRHSHAGGADRRHQHAFEVAASNHGGHEHQASSDCRLDLVKVVGEVKSHLHLQWLSLNLALPDSHGPSSDQDHHGSDLLAARPLKAVKPACHASSGHSRPLLTSLVNSCISPSTAATVWGQTSVLAAARTLLCDAARHERTGVLLI